MDGGSFSSSIGDSIDFDEKDLSLSNKLKVFKASAFDPDSYVTSRCRHMSEKRVDEVLDVLDEGEHMSKSKQSTLTPSALLSLQKVITEQKQKLAAQLAEASFQSSVSATELRSAV
ncbi:hypothetical protein RND71_010507 [Anisodus tanguticus]|uniref:Uncharacterized protein n=1 Tax=Anisodus tanguticus TaxID=243964 RepID=A0AAE1VJ66_9SOLA|nr:hypothetical protein RND71_010507 [Anisodus tanguticus]